MATSTSLNLPSGIAVDSSGNLYISDSLNQRIRKVTNGTITTIVGTGTPGFSGDGGPASLAKINLPQQLAVDNNGNVYFADDNNNRIRVARSGACSFSFLPPGLTVPAIPPTSYSFSAIGGTGSFNVIPPQGQVGCGWTATSDASWLTITSGSGGTDAGNVNYQISANASTSSRSGTITFAYNGQAGKGLTLTTFTIVESAAPPNCNYSVSPIASEFFSFVNQSFLSFGPSATPAAFSVATGAGCPWNAVTNVNWITVNGSSANGGAGQANFTVATNVSGSPRSGAFVIANQTFLVTQAAGSGSLTCVSSAGVPPLIRAEGLTELIGDILLNCSGVAPAGGITADVQAFFNADVTSRLLNSFSNSSEALLLLNEPTNLVVGTNTFPGLVVSANSILFPQVQLATGAGSVNLTLRLANVRLNAAALGVSNTLIPSTISASIVLNSSSTPVLSGSATVGAFIEQGVVGQVGVPSTGPDPTTQVALPLTFTEGFASAFKIRELSDPSGLSPGAGSESGFVNSSVLGPVIGVADTGTRLLARLSNIPSGLRLFAYLSPTGGSSTASARLVSADNNGAGGALVSEIPGFPYVEIPVVNSSAAVAWEVTQASPFALENLDFSLILQGSGQPPTSSQLGQIQAKLSSAPLSGVNTSTSNAPIPRFADTSVQQPLLNLTLTSVVQPAAGSSNGSSVAGQSLKSTPSSAHVKPAVEPGQVSVGSNVSFVNLIQNNGNVTASNVVVHDNLPPTLQFLSCSVNNGPCQGVGNNLLIPVTGSLTGGSTAMVTISAQVLQVPDGTLVSNSVAVTADQPNANLGTSTTSFIISHCSTCVSFTTGTNPPGLQYSVDGVLYSQSTVQPVTPGTNHVLAVAPQGQSLSGKSYTFTGWSTGQTGPSLSVPVEVATTVTANFMPKGTSSTH